MLFDTSFGSWNCGETFENKDAKWCFLAVFETILWKLELQRNIWNLTLTGTYLRYCKDVFEVGTADTVLKKRMLNVAFCRNLKGCFGSWNFWEFFKMRSLNGAFCRNIKLICTVKSIKMCPKSLLTGPVWGEGVTGPFPPGRSATGYYPNFDVKCVFLFFSNCDTYHLCSLA